MAAIGELRQTSVPDALWTLAQAPTPHTLGPSHGRLEWLWTMKEMATG
jgi:hypothetical protein